MNLRVGIVGLTALSVIAGVAGCKGKGGKKAPAAKAPPVATPSRLKSARSPTARARRTSVGGTLRYIGELVARYRVKLGPKVNGRVVRLRKDVGSKVRRGELVAMLDAVDVRRQLEEANAAVVTAKAQIGRAKAEVARATRELRRKRPLYKEDLVTRQQMDNVTSALEIANAGRRLAEAQLAQARTRVKTLMTGLRNHRVYAPFKGRVSRRLVDLGAMVGTRDAIYEIVTDHNLLVRFKVPTQDTERLPTSGDIAVWVDAHPTTRFSAKLLRVYPTVDAATRSLVVEAKLGDKAATLKAGMFARVEIEAKSERAAVVVPRSALVSTPRMGVVATGVAGGHRFVPVRVGRARAGASVEVSGLEAGTEVLLKPSPELVRKAIGTQTGGARSPSKPEPKIEPKASGKMRRAPSKRRRRGKATKKRKTKEKK